MLLLRLLWLPISFIIFIVLPNFDRIVLIYLYNNNNIPTILSEDWKYLENTKYYLNITIKLVPSGTAEDDHLYCVFICDILCIHILLLYVCNTNHNNYINCGIWGIDLFELCRYLYLFEPFLDMDLLLSKWSDLNLDYYSMNIYSDANLGLGSLSKTLTWPHFWKIWTWIVPPWNHKYRTILCIM